MSGPGGTINLSDGDDHWPGVGDDNSGSEWINAMDGKDSIFGGFGDDTLFGDGGDDDMLGDQGSDQLFGGEGNDRLQGGGGRDYIYDNEGTWTQIDAGDGDDYVQIGGNFDLTVVINGGNGFDILQSATTRLDQYLFIAGFEGLDTFGQTMIATAGQFAGFRMIRSSGENPSGGVSLGLAGVRGIDYFVSLSRALDGRSVEFFGSLGHDQILTGSGDDVIWGDLGNDFLSSANGKDTLHGSAGSDTLVGGKGRDVLTGGGGNDHFVFATAKDSPVNARPDRIVDFGRGNDRIDLSAMGDFFFNGDDGFHNLAGEVIYAQDAPSDTTSVFVDIDGNGVADFRVALDGLLELEASSFTL